MNGMLLVLIAFVLFITAYKVYGTYLQKLFDIDDNNVTPAHSMNDGVDYYPAKSPVLLGHHFASIAGAGPIVGPVIAAGFGWLPVYLWVVLGSIFFGGVHDYASIVASIRHQSKSIGFVIEKYIGISGKKLFLLFAWATLILVIAVFTIIVADTFTHIPSAGTSSILFMILAVLFGISVYRLKIKLWISTLVGVILLFLSIPAGNLFPLQLNTLTWQLILFAYIFIASVTPVWILLQPRDYLNSFFLYALIAGGLIGVFFAAPSINIPAFTTFSLDKVGYLFPALFVTVACGAISGFHSLVGSGTTAKQLNKETDAKMVGYGGMLIEGILAVLSLTAVASMVNEEFLDILVNKGPVPAFSLGVARFLHAIPFFNLSIELGQTFTALAVSAFALTSLDTATRLARFMFQEFFEVELKEDNKLNETLRNRFVSTGITVGVGAALTFSGQTMSIWPVFGSANQLLAALALLALTAWVIKTKKNFIFILIPMLFMFSVTLTALGMLIYQNLIINNYTLSIISLLLFVLSIILGIKAYVVLGNSKEFELPITEK
ncbi:carbon starvation CstA family protein [Stygiobacter electus]|jgi:carbon starvation protein|uniref:Carbon starvation protein A n=1 Tax=Stygiobacter electus TaxID=3032292 RepID=A0AAE3NYJ3_9BACT|nr:carbon starvation protein A [Stygiobacter electus]MDF1611082.1 carbon starvation protein A [Stygiobacter electus]